MLHAAVRWYGRRHGRAAAAAAAGAISTAVTTEQRALSVCLPAVAAASTGGAFVPSNDK